MQNHGVSTYRPSPDVMHISLAKPDIHNAFDEQMIARLQQIFDALSEDNSIRIVVLQGEGKNFSAGADLKWMKRMVNYTYAQNVADARALSTMLASFNRLPQLTIAKVQGAAFGGALGLIACCDIALASNNASFCLSEVKLGLIPAAISPYVIQAIGQRAARRYFQTAEVFDAKSATTMGLISECLTADDLDKRINSIVDKVLQNGPNAMQAAKQLVLNVAARELDEQLMDETSQAIAAVRVSAEGQEGLSAFLQKRKAQFGGKV